MAMIRMARMVLSDYVGLIRVCGFLTATRWLTQVAMRLPSCLRSRNLQPADLAMGHGPFRARRGDARAKLYGEQVVSGIRELWVRNVYLRGDFLKIPQNATVVDLGANMGNFTVLALGHGPNVRVVSVEPDPRCVAKLRDNLAANDWSERVQICTSFVGGRTEAQQKLEPEIAAPETGAPDYLSEEQFVQNYGLSRIDMLKCDIEGSEFGLLRPGSLLLKMTDQLAVELHDWGGDVEQFKRMLKDQGFEIVITQEAADGCVLQARRMRRASMPSSSQMSASTR